MDEEQMKKHFEECNNFYKSKFPNGTQEVIDNAGETEKASVLIPFMIVNDELVLVLTLRSPKVSNFDKEISFPGGKVDEGDTNVIETALRESYEEIGLPCDCTTVIGCFEDASVLRRKRRNGTMSRYLISVVIGIVKDGTELIQNEEEVDEIIYCHLNDLFSNVSFVEYNGATGKGEYAVLKIDNNGAGHYVYGYTAMLALVFCAIFNVIPTKDKQAAYDNLTRLKLQSFSEGLTCLLDFAIAKIDKEQQARL
eukprot:Seg2002.11 transcript_id=Seg2002.11/GoldUCD/mRNA.D3Y31 product="putative Nudix hydrolase NudL" protein_id=Seg2002.11/GoldUCD/D3Y31